jgi:hypothetical protein
MVRDQWIGGLAGERQRVIGSLRDAVIAWNLPDFTSSCRLRHRRAS